MFILSAFKFSRISQSFSTRDLDVCRFHVDFQPLFSSFISVPLDDQLSMLSYDPLLFYLVPARALSLRNHLRSSCRCCAVHPKKWMGNGERKQVELCQSLPAADCIHERRDFRDFRVQISRKNNMESSVCDHFTLFNAVVWYLKGELSNIGITTAAAQ